MADSQSKTLGPYPLATNLVDLSLVHPPVNTVRYFIQGLGWVLWCVLLNYIVGGVK